MSGRRRSKRRQPAARAWWEATWLAGLVLLVLAAFVAVALTGREVPWWVMFDGDRLPNPVGAANPAGPVGAVLAYAFRLGFGAAWAWAMPALLVLAGVEALSGRPGAVRWFLTRGTPLWLATTAWFALRAWPWDGAVAARWAGFAGVYLARGGEALLASVGSVLIFSLLLLVALAFATRPLQRACAPVAGPVVRFAWRLAGRLARAIGSLLAAIGRGAARSGRATAEKSAATAADGATARREPPAARSPETAAATLGDETAPKERRVHWPEEPEAAADDIAAIQPDGDAPEDEYDLQFSPAPTGPVELPGLDLLAEPRQDQPELSPAELDAAADKLEETLRSFGVEGEVKDVRPGPVVTTFEYQPAAGIRVNQIVQRANDLALAMRARSLRMEAPIPGKAAVGIEIPNGRPQLVSLREVLQLEQGKPRKPLTITLGKDVIGQPVSIDLAAQPHLLVAGSTGSGKSVCLNALITNLLLYNDPSRVRLLLVDPKMLEMSVYNGTPHLLLPVVTDPKDALRALNWMVAQMDVRYRHLSKHAVRNIEQYNDKVARGEIRDAAGEPVAEPMPYYVTIVDELADLMVQLGQDFEVPVTRLAQKARAVGLHLVLATQRPSVDVLTGVIKANIPCRIAFRVIQRNDSRTILDQNGAEQLLGRGDMLYLQPGRATPVRVHGAYVDVTECAAVVDHWRGYADVAQEISLTAGGEGGAGVHTGEDDLFDDAVRVVVTHQSGSTSLLQRRLRIGYTRAGRLMDMMEEAGIVGPFTGSKARDVLVKPADLPDLFGDEPGEP
ncbi:MAG TPA: DNA translocase FtsK 4TM domain-containing protein [Candidatus Krumholzibacteria bacterium]|nr:DNA translocase FtsK 4TM domain-containing protein [Candidatus Krumholzibacteria bacterium]HPD71713.1 DNA translocase FtsK 4TM domain-containing protein [Candidatus Krumholzibacteria bacterium]HRY41354.1 DNA translocase FtsK 4TM domain-containing protein [Candidatus Krumholzibacteria bacterium]